MRTERHDDANNRFSQLYERVSPRLNLKKHSVIHDSLLSTPLAHDNATPRLAASVTVPSPTAFLNRGSTSGVYGVRELSVFY